MKVFGAGRERVVSAQEQHWQWKLALGLVPTPQTRPVPARWVGGQTLGGELNTAQHRGWHLPAPSIPCPVAAQAAWALGRLWLEGTGARQ